MTLVDQEAELRGDSDRKVLVFNCPCKHFSKDPEKARTHCFGRIRINVHFDGSNPPQEPPYSWKADGEFPNLSLVPSVNIHPSGDPVGSYCAGWHGYITSGEFKSC